MESTTAYYIGVILMFSAIPAVSVIAYLLVNKFKCKHKWSDVDINTRTQKCLICNKAFSVGPKECSHVWKEGVTEGKTQCVNCKETRCIHEWKLHYNTPKQVMRHGDYVFLMVYNCRFCGETKTEES